MVNLAHSKKTFYGLCRTYNTQVVVTTVFVEILLFLFRDNSLEYCTL